MADRTTNDPRMTRGNTFASQSIERVTKPASDTDALSIFSISTCEFAAAILTESDYGIGRSQ